MEAANALCDARSTGFETTCAEAGTLRAFGSVPGESKNPSARAAHRPRTIE
jgi:hypothetical protein